jgi:uncharacterized protein (TIGR02246 family)
MRRARLFIALILAAAALASCSGSSSSRDPEADKAAIRAFITRASRLSRAEDASAWVNLFAEGGVYMPPDGPEINTRAALQEYADVYLGEFEPHITITPVDVEVFGDWGFARTTVKGTIVPRSGGDPLPEPIPVDAKEIGIYQRQQNGDWKLWRLIGNSNRSQ